MTLKCKLEASKYDTSKIYIKKLPKNSGFLNQRTDSNTNISKKHANEAYFTNQQRQNAS